jgi:ABC-type nitrate/sulfonate/bicarbonate transport system permease component
MDSEISTNFSNTTTQAIVITSNYLESDEFMFYGDRVLSSFLDIFTNGIEDYLSTQENFIEAFCIGGIVGLTIFYAVGWNRFLDKLRTDFMIVKRTFSILPIQVITTNNYIKKFLISHSKFE